jgi:adenylate cyclase
MTARQRVALHAGLWIAVSSAVVGAALSVLESRLDPSAVARGALAGLAISMPVYAFDLVLNSSASGRELRRQPFAVVVGIRTFGYLVLIVLGLALAATVVGAPIVGDGGFLAPVTVGIAFGVAFAANVVWQLDRSLGQGALVSLVTGRYHRPHVQERIFLFLDLQGSTAAAERLGPERFLTLLDRIAFDVADAVLEARGQIHAYVGDEVIVTWPAEDGLRDARCVRGCFEMMDSVNGHADRYDREFGFVPRFHAALHVGPVVVGEMGDLHREIVFLGDTVNTTARIEALSGELRRDVLASRELVDRLPGLPAGVTSVAVGPIALRGKEEPVELCAIERIPGARRAVSSAGAATIDLP